MPTQILFASMDPLVCPVLNHAVYVEMIGMQGLGWKFLIGRVLSDLLSTLKNCLQVLIQSSKGGEAWNPQPPQGSFNLREPVLPFERLDFHSWPLTG
jgi:hypothetical protein